MVIVKPGVSELKDLTDVDDALSPLDEDILEYESIDSEFKGVNIDTRISANSDVTDNTAHRNDVTTNPHATTLEQARNSNNQIAGDIDANSNTITNVADPSNDGDAASKGYVDSKIQGLDWVESVLSFFDPTSALPVGPTLGDRYISSATANGWTDNNIYEWDGAAWDETVISEGKATWVEDEDLVYVYNGSAWVKFGSTVSHNNTSGKQGGTTNEYYHITSAQHTDLTDGGDSALHYHATDRARANHTGTQVAATISDFDAEVANNSAVAASTSHITATGASHTYIDQNVTTGGSPVFLNAQMKYGNDAAAYTLNQLEFSYNAGVDQYRHALKTRHSGGTAAGNAIDLFLWEFGTDAIGDVGTFKAISIDKTGSSLWNDLDVNGNFVVTAQQRIGTDTSITSQALAVASASQGTHLGGQFGLYDNAAMAIDVGGLINLGGQYTTGGAYTEFAGLWAGKDTAVSGEYGGYLVLGSRAHATGVLKEVMRLASDGNVGVGITDPLAKIHVAGSNPAIRLDDTTNALYSWNIQSVGARAGEFEIAHVADNKIPLMINTDGDVFIGSDSSTTPVNPPIYAESGGKVGIRNSSPTYNIDAISRTAAAGGPTLRLSDTYVENSQGGFEIGFASDNRYIGAAGTGLYTFSDHNLYLGANGSTNRFMTIATSGKVGIGTIAPTAKLHVVNDGTGNGLFIDQNGNGIGMVIDTEATTQPGLQILGDAVRTAGGTGALLAVRQASGSSTGTNTYLQNAGTGKNLHIDQDGNGIALEIDSEATTQSAFYIGQTIANAQSSFQIAHGGTTKFRITREDSINEDVLVRLGSYSLWVDSTGDLRIKSGIPTSDTDGTVVGTQT